MPSINKTTEISNRHKDTVWAVAVTDMRSILVDNLAFFINASIFIIIETKTILDPDQIDHDKKSYASTVSPRSVCIRHRSVLENAYAVVSIDEKGTVIVSSLKVSCIQGIYTATVYNLVDCVETQEV
ncbi:MAG: hypothetical protein ABEI13_00950 [Candidatus Paceibacteria bacterium]